MAVDLKRSVKASLIERRALQKKLVVVAIDFGTTYSGYAFSFKSEFDSDPLQIRSPTWLKGSQGGVVSQTSTCALFSPDSEFHSFGYEAEMKYNELATDSKHHDWFYFRRFKMILYDNPKLDVRFKLTDDKCNSMPALEVFSKSIEYLKDSFQKEFEKSKNAHPVKVEPKDIQWVLTVPAIWNDKAKQFMREAAIHAGIPTDQLSIALEPEAASLFCRYIPVERVQGDSAVEIRSFCPRDKYLILDAGGGTVDITVHEIQDDDTVKELYVTNGGEWGGTSIDKKFEGLLNDIVGADTMEIIAFNHKDDFLDIMSNFEIKKRSITPETKDKVSITLPSSLPDTYRTLNENKELTDGGRVESFLRDHVTFDKDKLRVDAKIIKGLYEETCGQIVNHLRQIFDKRVVKGVKKILMVGGFSESKMLQGAIKNAFRDKTVIVPDEAGLAVLRGAVAFGHYPTMIKSRICRNTYGIKAMRDFQPGLDRPEKRIVRQYGKTIHFLCENTFSIHATVGESIDIGEPRMKHEYVPSEPGERKLRISVFRSPRSMPVYTDEDNSEHVGDIDVELEDSDKGTERPVTVAMIFGDTELKVQLVENRTGQTKEAYFDCLRKKSNS